MRINVMTVQQYINADHSQPRPKHAARTRAKEFKKKRRTSSQKFPQGASPAKKAKHHAALIENSARRIPAVLEQKFGGSMVGSQLDIARALVCEGAIKKSYRKQAGNREATALETLERAAQLELVIIELSTHGLVCVRLPEGHVNYEPTAIDILQPTLFRHCPSRYLGEIQFYRT